MTRFQTKEEYEKWKAEKLKRSIEIQQAQKEAEGQILEELKEEDNLRGIWICPECLQTNDNSQLKCQCGYTPDEKYSEYLKGNVTSSEIYKVIEDAYYFNNDEKELSLINYLLKRFPNTIEAEKIKERMDNRSVQVICGHCGTNNIYNPKYYKKDKCIQCGDFLYQYISKIDSKKTHVRREKPWHLSPSDFTLGLIIVGIIFLISSITMDTTISTGFGDRIHNIGLLNKKLIFIIVSSLIVLIGVILHVFYSRKR